MKKKRRISTLSVFRNSQWLIYISITTSKMIYFCSLKQSIWCACHIIQLIELLDTLKLLYSNVADSSSETKWATKRSILVVIFIVKRTDP